jgi:hypothetical protein
MSVRVVADGALSANWDIFNLDGEQSALAGVSEEIIHSDCCSHSGQINKSEAVSTRVLD